MLLSTWLTVVTICLLGAMSPGPSVALVLRHTLLGGRKQGMTTGIFHGLGIGIYAFMTVLGLAVVINTHPPLLHGLQWLGALYLLWLGVVNLKARPAGNITRLTPTTSASAARDGFMMAFLNPKAALFFLALFSQVVGGETSLPAKSGYALTAMLVDMSWYVLVAWLFSQPSWLRWLQQYSHWVERFFGVILLLLAARIFSQLL